MVKLEGFVLSHEGSIRGNNEDNFLLFGKNKKDPLENRISLSKSVLAGKKIAGVFDGMGGETAGEIASLMASECYSPCDIGNVRESMRRQSADANRKICATMAEHNCIMGTTAVLLFFDDRKCVCANLGDSRAYLYRGSNLFQLSADHSEGQMMIDLGKVTREEARQSGAWHRLTKHLGIPENEYIAEPFVGEAIDLHERDLFMLCSDGLTDMVSDDEILSMLDTYGHDNDLIDIAGRLLGRAIENGGEDNVTIMLIRVTPGLFI